MATLAEKMAQLEAMREARSNSGDTVGSDIFGSWTKELGRVQSSLVSLLDAVIKQRQKNAAATEMGRTDNVNTAIREMLSAKLDADKVERERHNRMMDMAESLIPKVSDEQLKAVRMQQLAYREHKKTLEAELNLEKKKYDLQKKDAEAMQKRRVKAIEGERAEANFAIKDKYGTIENAITGLGNSGGDSLGKFLVAGLGRYVKERKETPIAEAVKEKYDAQVQQQNNIAEAKKALADKEFGTRKEDIEETAAIRAAKQGISDPGSAAKLYSARAQKVSDIAKIGESLESGLLSGNFKLRVPQLEHSLSEVAKAIRGQAPNVAAATVAKAEPEEIPVLTKEGIVSSVEAETKPAPSPTPSPAPSPATSPAPVAEKNESVASTLKSEIPPKAAPKNAKFTKAPRQSSSLLTPVVKRNAAPVATVNPAPGAVGKFGSKAGAVNLGGIGKALGGIATKLGSLAGSALKFLGPWGMVASALMSFDRLVPIFSSLAGALMDLTKLIMPLLISTTIEGFAQILGGINGLITLLDNAPLIGRKWTKESSTQAALTAERDKEAQRQATLKENKRQAAQGGQAIDTTSARRGVAMPTITRRETALTTPAEATAISEQVAAAKAPGPQQYQLSDWQQQQGTQNRDLRDAVIAASKNPGTTPIMVGNPALAPFPV